ncbi:MAG: hypothetical protein HOO67_01745 [Candidatus Peribacteraceae bacterium]|nr:hypothetical protein [Candidatus Peribacteraceae bacterium]
MGKKTHSHPLFDAKGTAIALALIAAIVSVNGAQYSASIFCNAWVQLTCDKENQDLVWPWEQNVSPVPVESDQSHFAAEGPVVNTEAEKPCNLYKTSYGFGLQKNNDIFTVHNHVDENGVSVPNRIAQIGGCANEVIVGFDGDEVSIEGEGQVRMNGYEIRQAIEEINGEQNRVILITTDKAGVISDEFVSMTIGGTTLLLERGDDVALRTPVEMPVPEVFQPVQAVTVEPPADVTVDKGQVAMPTAQENVLPTTDVMAVPQNTITSSPKLDPNSLEAGCNAGLPWLVQRCPSNKPVDMMFYGRGATPPEGLEIRNNLPTPAIQGGSSSLPQVQFINTTAPKPGAPGVQINNPDYNWWTDDNSWGTAASSVNAAAPVAPTNIIPWNGFNSSYSSPTVSISSPSIIPWNVHSAASSVSSTTIIPWNGFNSSYASSPPVIAPWNVHSAASSVSSTTIIPWNGFNSSYSSPTVSISSPGIIPWNGYSASSYSSPTSMNYSSPTYAN